MPGQLSQITLGTASLGMAYGIANRGCAPDSADAFEILDLAWQAGITAFDTAPAYGEAERRLGRWREHRRHASFLITKLPSLSSVSNAAIGPAIRRALAASLQASSAEYADAYLTHDAADYLNPAVRHSLTKLRSSGMIGAFGPSVYTPDEVFAAIDADPPDIIQLPLNALDQSMLFSRALDSCDAANVTVLARSVFLQGLLLMQPVEIKPELAGLAGPIGRLQDLARTGGTSVLSLAFRYVRDLPGVSSLVVGVNSRSQLCEIIGAAREPRLEGDILDAVRELATVAPRELLDPRGWP